MHTITIEAKDVHALLEVSTHLRETVIKSDQGESAANQVLFKFLGIRDPRIPAVQKIFNAVSVPLGIDRQALPVLNVGSDISFPEASMTIEPNAPVLAPLKELATQYLARKDFLWAMKQGKAVYRLPIPPMEQEKIVIKGVGSLFESEEPLSETQRMITSCNLLDLKFTIGHSGLTDGMCIKYDDLTAVMGINRILRVADANEQSGLLGKNSPYHLYMA